jgi:hypothetical protein
MVPCREYYRAILVSKKFVIFGCVDEINCGLQTADWMERENVVWGKK